MLDNGGALQSCNTAQTKHAYNGEACRLSSITELNSNITNKLKSNTVLGESLAANDSCKVVRGNPPQKSLADPGYDLRNFFERKRLILNLVCGPAIATNSTTNLSLAYTSIPEVDAICIKYLHSRHRRLCLSFTYLGVPTSLGLYRVSFYPRTYRDDMNEDPKQISRNNAHDDMCRAASGPHVDIDISKSEMVCIDLPWISNRDWLRTFSGGFGMWQMHIADIVRPKSVTNTPAINFTIKVHMWLEGVEFDGLHYQSGTVEGEEVHELQESYAQYITRMASSIGSFSNTIVTVMNMGAKAAMFLGLSIPQNEANNMVVSVPHGNPSVGSGCNANTSFIGTNQAISTNRSSSQFPLGDPGDMSLYYNLLRWGMGSYVTGTDLITGYSYTINPYTLRNTPLGYFSIPFKFWRGSIRCKIRCISSPMTRWQVALNVFPDTGGASASLITNGTAIYYTFDVEGTTEFEFDIPYSDEHPYRETAISGDGSTIRVYCPVPLKDAAGANIPPTMEFWFRAGLDYEVAVPDPVYMSRFQLQSGTVSGSFTAYTYGEVLDLKTLCNTQQMIGYYTDNIAWKRIPALGYASAQMHTECAWTGTTFAQWFSFPFVGRNGGSIIRMTRASTADNLSVTLEYLDASAANQEPITPIGVYDKAILAPGTYFAPGQHCLDVTVPCRNRYSYVDCRASEYTLGGPLHEHFILNVRGGGASDVGDFVVYAGGADDFCFGGFLGVPNFVYRT